MLTGTGTDGSLYPCIYCHIKFEQLPTGRHCALKSVKNRRNRLRNYDDALGQCFEKSHISAY